MATKASKRSGAKAAPPSPANTLEDHSVSPAEMAAKQGPPANRAAAAPATAAATAKADAKTAERIADETKSEAETKTDSLADKIAKAGLIQHEDNANGQRWIGKAQAEPCKGLDHRCRHTPLNEVSPMPGMTIYPSEGEAFSLPMDFPRDSTPAAWATVASPKGALLLG